MTLDILAGRSVGPVGIPPAVQCDHGRSVLCRSDELGRPDPGRTGLGRTDLGGRIGTLVPFRV